MQLRRGAGLRGLVRVEAAAAAVPAADPGASEHREAALPHAVEADARPGRRRRPPGDQGVQIGTARLFPCEPGWRAAQASAGVRGRAVAGVRSRAAAAISVAIVAERKDRKRASTG